MTNFIDDSTGIVHIFPTVTEDEDISAQLETATEVGLRPLTQKDVEAQRKANPAKPVTNITQFVSDVKTAFGGATGILAQTAKTQSALALSFTSAHSKDWTDLQIYLASLAAASGDGLVAIKKSAVENNIPITLD